jgi:hypothetical protein
MHISEVTEHRIDAYSPSVGRARTLGLQTRRLVSFTEQPTTTMTNLLRPEAE